MIRQIARGPLMGHCGARHSVAGQVEAFPCNALDLARRDAHASVDGDGSDPSRVDDDGVRLRHPETTGSFPGG